MAGEDTPVTVLNNVEIFRVGRWRGNKTVEATPALLDQIVGNFHQLNAKVSGYGVPVKLGHSDAVGAPAFGWMSDLQRVGDVLVADFSDVDPAIVDAIGKRRYNSVSIELYPVVNYSGKIFENVLGGVALLGAEWPAVKGLKPLSGSLFSENEEKLVLSDKEMEDVKTFTETEHDTLMADAVVKATSDLSAKLAASEARASTAEAAVKAFREDADKASVAAIIEAAEKKGVVVPANKASVQAMADALLASTNDSTKTLATFKAFVDGLPAKIDLTEKTEGKGKPGAEATKASDEVNERATVLMKDGKAKDYETAVKAVFAADPDLKTRYAQEM
jgi:hypothetical protein